MFAQIVTFQETPEQVDAGIAHVLDDIIPALERAPGLTGAWLADRAKGKRLSIMVWESEAAAAAAMAEVQKRLAVSKHTRPAPVSVEKFDVYAFGPGNDTAATSVVRKVQSAIEHGDFPAARALLHDDFTFSGPVPQPIGPDSWLGVHQALYAGMPDLRFNASHFTDDGATVRFDVALTMHHTGVLTLPPFGVADVRPTNKSIALPPESATVVVRDGKLASWANVTPPDGGVPRILAEVGAG